MANSQNLIPINKRTKGEQKKISQKGGRASGIARKREAELRRVLDFILTMEVNDPAIRKQLEDMGLENDNQTLLALSILQRAIKGDMNAASLIFKVVSTKDNLDIEEQRERIRLLKNENKRRKLLDAEVTQTLIIVDEWASEDKI